MKIISQKIWEFIKKAFSPKYLNATLLIIIAILFVLYWQSCNNNKRIKEEARIEKELNSQNLAALKDSIHKYYNESKKQYEFFKASYVLTKDDLKNYNAELYNEFLDFKGDVVAAIKAEIQGTLPNHEIGNDVVNLGNNKWALKWTQDQGDDWFSQHIEGLSKFRIQYSKDSLNIFGDKTELTNNITKVNIKFAHTKINENDTMARYQVEAICNSPFITLTSLDGAYFIDSKYPKFITPVCSDKVSRLTFGPMLGYGLNFGKDAVSHGVLFGVGVQYNLRWKDLKFWNSKK
jgi:hypothetical protein